MGLLGERTYNHALLFMFPFLTFAFLLDYLLVQLKIQHQVSGAQAVVVLES